MSEWTEADGTFDQFQATKTGLFVGIFTLLITVILEAISIPSVRVIVAAPGGHALYAQAWCFTILNSIMWGPLIYGLVAHLFVYDRACSGPVPCLLATAGRVSGLLLIHSIGYWYAHKTMHTSWLFWAHSFHHRFSAAVTPCVAMAVSPAEFLLAYMVPFIVGGLIVRPDRLSLLLAVCIISLSNLMVHTERCQGWNLPWFLVSADKHLQHHRRPNKHYAAPTLDVDAILLQVRRRY
mmetsp:Transcript_2977/g.4762  ORF Transcript_2977/g.4762 Transcript_2977/m.4762 type:complete len:237 (+) Transcript_2977:100-810(+)